MSLIKCPECGKVFSDRSHHCPQCGIDTASAIQTITGANKTAPSPFAEEAHQETHMPPTQPTPVPQKTPVQVPQEETNENIQNFNQGFAPQQQPQYHYYTPQAKSKPNVGRILLYVVLILLICGGIYGITVMLDKSGLLNSSSANDSVEVIKPLPQDPSFDEFDGFESDQPATETEEPAKPVEKKAVSKPKETKAKDPEPTAPAEAPKSEVASPAPVEAPVSAPAPVQQPAE